MARARLVDDEERLVDQESTDTNEDTVDTLESQDTTSEVTQEDPQPTQEELPEKYKGKSLEDIVRMHQEAEKALGRQSSEVGQLRSVVDEYIQTQLQSQQQAPQQSEDNEEDDVDFFIDPKTAVSRAIENHPSIRQAEEYTQQQRKQAALSTLKANHPDMESILQDNKFAEWVKGSKIRTQLFVQADQQYDYEAANELFSLWKERRSTVQQAADMEKQSRKQQLKSANTGNARGSGEPARKKVYRRADIIKLMKTDPDRYAQLQPEIMAAYSEGRVK